MPPEKVRKGKAAQAAPETPIEWTRADPAALEQFDPATKTCTMNCGKSSLDPRTYKELKFLCDDCDCHAATVPHSALVELAPGEDLDALRRDAERWRWLRERAVRVQGSEIWYQGVYLDLRADIGLGHARESAEPAPEKLCTKPE